MKKSELKALLRIIAEEVALAKKAELSETKGLSGFKETKDSSEHTEKIATSKDLTGKTEPKEKEEGKKLPKVPTPKQPSVGLKEEIMNMIREAIDECGLEEMAKRPVKYDGSRLEGSIAKELRSEDPNSPTGWSLNAPYKLKDGRTVPVGTPVDAPQGEYQRTTTNPNMGRPKKTPAPISTGSNKAAEVARTEEAVEEFVKYNPNASEQEVTDAIADQSTDETPLSLDPAVIVTAIQKAKESLGSEKASNEPTAASMAASEKAKKDRTMSSLRAYLMRKKGLKPNK